MSNCEYTTRPNLSVRSITISIGNILAIQMTGDQFHEAHGDTFVSGNERLIQHFRIHLTKAQASSREAICTLLCLSESWTHRAKPKSNQREHCQPVQSSRSNYMLLNDEQNPKLVE